MKRLILLIGAFMFLNANISYALTTSWTGTAMDGDWNTAGNWDNGVPGAGDEAVFNNINATVMNTGATPQISRLIVKGGGGKLVTLNMDLNINGKMISDRALQVNAGQLTLAAGYVFNIEGPTGKEGIYTNNSNALLTIGGTVNVTAVDKDGLNVNTGILTNNGTLTIDGGANDIRTMLINNGTLNNNSTLTLTGGKQFSRAQINTGGTLNNEKGGVLDIENGRIKVAYTAPNNGTLKNNGYITSTINVPIRADTGGGANITNNGFYKFGNTTNNFADDGNGNPPVGTNNGFDVNNGSIDAGGANEVDFSATTSGMEIYTWTGPATSRANLATGILDINGFDFPDQTGPHNITLDVPAYNSLFTIQVSNVGAGSALPIELTFFRAIARTESVEIQWQTAVEINNDYMAVEHSTNGIQFEEIGRVRGQGNSQILNTYSLLDNNPATGVNYYRLHQVDFDGTDDYSHIVQVTFKGGEATDLLPLYPTTARGHQSLHLDLTAFPDENMTFDVFDFNGRQVMSFDLQGGSVVDFRVDQLQTGMYIIKERSIENNLSTRFIIAR